MFIVMCCGCDVVVTKRYLKKHMYLFALIQVMHGIRNMSYMEHFHMAFLEFFCLTLNEYDNNNNNVIISTIIFQYNDICMY